MKELRYQIRYALPIWMIGLITNWLPENRISQKWRGWLLSVVLHAGRNLRVARGVLFVNAQNLHLGDDVYFGPGTWLNGLGGLTIGSGVMTGPYACITTTSHGFVNDSVHGGGTHTAPVCIGDGTWIAAHGVVAAGVTVGRGNLVAANAVVTKSTPDNSIVGGVPARVLSQRTDNPSPLGARIDA